MQTRSEAQAQPVRGDACVAQALQAVLRMVPALGGARYRAAYRHLQELNVHPAELRAEAARHVVLERLRNARFRRYEINTPSAWRRRIRSMAVHDPHRLWQVDVAPRTIALLHTGEYRLAIARVIEAHPRPTRFIVPALCTEGDPMHRALKCLEQFGHSVEIVHPATPNLAPTLLGRMHGGATAVAFIDMPAAVGQQRFSDPVRCRFLGCDALMALTPLQLAAAVGCPVLLAGARMDAQNGGQLNVLHHAADLRQPGSIQALLMAASTHIQADPADWFLLDRLSSYLRTLKNARTLAD